jgi:hypothetical protein
MDVPRIIVAIHLDHWSAWWEDEAQFAAGGSDPAEAVDRLLQLRDRRPKSV